MIDKTKNESEKSTGAKGEDIIAGRNAVNEALRSGRTIDSLYVARGQKTGSLTALIAKAKQKDITIKEADVKKLDFMCGNANHQGVVAVAAIKEYASLDDIFQLAQSRGEAPFIIIPKRRAVGLTYAVGKSSAGAVEYVPVVRVTNMAATVDLLKEKGLWIYTTDMKGETWCTVDYTGPVGLVIGSEGSGVSRLVKEKADFTVTLPMVGHINSLNASVACGVLCYEIARQRQGIKVN